jgi:hypothetical protein
MTSLSLTSKNVNFSNVTEELNDEYKTKKLVVRNVDIASIIKKQPTVVKEYTMWELSEKAGVKKSIPENRGGYQTPTEPLSDDWMLFKDDVIDEFESRLKNILMIREKSSRRRCVEIENKRNKFNYDTVTNETLKLYDEQINLSELLKSNFKYMNLKTPKSHSGSNNYMAQLADENSRKKCHCERFIEKERKFHENEIVNFGCDKKKLLKLPKIKSKNKNKKKKSKIRYF